MHNLQPQEKEEIWFARVVMVLGAYQALDVFLNLATILKVHSGLPIVFSGTNETTATAYLVASAIVGFYLLTGGSLLSRLAYGRRAPRSELYAEISMPDWRRGLSVTIRSLGAYQVLIAIAALSLAAAYYHRPIADRPINAPRPEVVEMAWALERVAIGFVLLSLGGRIAAFFTGRPSAEPADASNHKS